MHRLVGVVLATSSNFARCTAIVHRGCVTHLRYWRVETRARKPYFSLLRGLRDDLCPCGRSIIGFLLGVFCYPSAS